MINITLKQMRYVLAVEQAGHFGRAASLCHVSQPALSQQISQLEDMCGAQLFDRTTKPVRPTPFGQEFINRARPILADARNLAQFAFSRSGSPRHPLRFGMIPTIAPYILPHIFPPLLAEFPDPGFEIIEGQTEKLHDMLDHGELDIALIATRPAGNKVALDSIRLFRDRFFLASGPQQDFEQPVNLSELPREKLLLLDEGHCFRDQMIKVCGLENEQGALSFSATSLSTIMAFVANGQGLTLLPEISIARETSDKRIRLYDLAPPVASRTLSLIFRKNTPFKTLFHQIADQIRQTHPQGREAGFKP